MAIGMLAVTAVSYLVVLGNMLALSPFEYTYFSPVVGGLQGAVNNYDTDYYGICTLQAAEWLNQNYQRYTHSAKPTVVGGYLLYNQLAPELSPALKLESNVPQPDFYISYTRWGHDKDYPTFRTIHTVSAEGVTLCVVKVNPSIAPGP
jgi:hypothetical protein